MKKHRVKTIGIYALTVIIGILSFLLVVWGGCWFAIKVFSDMPIGILPIVMFLTGSIGICALIIIDKKGGMSKDFIEFEHDHDPPFGGERYY